LIWSSCSGVKLSKEPSRQENANWRICSRCLSGVGVIPDVGVTAGADITASVGVTTGVDVTAGVIAGVGIITCVGITNGIGIDNYFSGCTGVNVTTGMGGRRFEN
jgi:hypothetical protein